MCKKIIILIVFLLLPVFSSADSITSLDGRKLNLDQERKEYSFIITGHIYGSMSSPYPGTTTLANIDQFNQMKSDFMILLGDIIREPSEREINFLKTSFLSKLSFPTFNVVGNHDWIPYFQKADEHGWGTLYKQHFGDTFYSFKYGSELFVILDGESHNGMIYEEQKEFFVQQIEHFKNNDDLQNIFIFSHRVLWALNNPPFKKMLPYVNGARDFPQAAETITNYFLPLLKSIKNKKIYFVGGDIGSPQDFPLLYEKDKDSNVTYVATSLGDKDIDLALKIEVQSGNVIFHPVSLTGKELFPIEHYSVSYWMTVFTGNQADRPEEAGGLVSKIKSKAMKLLSNINFWIGSSIGFFCITLMLVIIITIRR